MRILHRILSIFLLATLTSAMPVLGGEFWCDFNNDLPSGVKLYGHAQIRANDGIDKGPALQLTPAEPEKRGSVVIDSPDGASEICGFIAQFNLLIGGGSGADGVSFCFSPETPDEPFGESGQVASKDPDVPDFRGLLVSFDTYKLNNQVAPAIIVFFNRALVKAVPFRELRLNRFADTVVQLTPDGTLNVSYDGTKVIHQLPIPGWQSSNGRFGFGARTGGLNDRHIIDNVRITTATSSGPFVETFGPIGDDIPLLPALQVVLRDFKTKVDANSIALTLNGTVVAARVSRTGDQTQVEYETPTFLSPGEVQEVRLAFAGEGAATTNEFAYRFQISPHVLISK